MKWTSELIEKLIVLYPNTPNYELNNVFGITEKALTAKAYKLGLNKSKECKSFLIGKRNKMVGRDLSFEVLKKIASQFKTRGEFQLKDSSAYSSARLMGILDDICSHMVSKSFSIPQLTMKKILNCLITEPFNYNDRKTLKPFEIDLYYPSLKLGFEYNGKGWHINNEKDNIKNKLAINNEITLITIIENSRKYEEDIKKQIEDNLNIINKISYLNITKDMVNEIFVGNIYQEVYDKNDLFLIAKSYKNKKEFRDKDRSSYNKLYRMGLLNESIKETT